LGNFVDINPFIHPFGTPLSKKWRSMSWETYECIAIAKTSVDTVPQSLLCKIHITLSHIIDDILQLEQQEYFNCSGPSGDYLGAILHWPNAISGNN